ncbi:MAG: site-specific integrase [Egibacteraceae bacterium]
MIRKVLSSALTSAQREELVSRNVARLAVLPAYTPDEIEPWAADEARRFLEVSRLDTLYPAFVLLVMYGLRRGEVLGLRWRDVDFAHGVIRVCHQLQRVGHSLQLGPVKTKAGRRPLPILGFIREVLIDYRGKQGQKRQAAGATWRGGEGGEALLFTTQDGRPMEASTLVRAFHRVCKQHGLRPIRMHGLRHGFATLLKDLGVPVRDAQQTLGHARVSTTQEIYEHGHLNQRRVSLERVAAVLTMSNEKYYTSPYRLSSGRCRQRSRQGADFIVSNTSVIPSAGGGTLTRGLILGKSVNVSLQARLTSINTVMQARTRQWLLGCVAVKYSRQINSSQQICYACRLPRRTV